MKNNRMGMNEAREILSSRQYDGSDSIRRIIERSFSDREVSDMKKKWLRDSFEKVYVRENAKELEVNCRYLLAAVFCII